MLRHYIYAFLIGSQILNVKEAFKFDVKKFGKILTQMQDKNSKFMRIEKHIECIYQCSRRPWCKFFMANFVEDPLVDSDYKCTLTSHPEEHPDIYFVTDTCNDRANYIYKYPSAIAGACADNKCTDDQICSSVLLGGYKCLRARGRRIPRKKKRERK